MGHPPNGERVLSRIHGLPDWITPELIVETLAVWQPHYDKQLTDDDAIEILLGVATLLGDVDDETVRGAGESL